MGIPTGATNYITVTSTAASVAASMPDVGTTYLAHLLLDEATSTNWEGGAATFVSGLAADYSDLRVTDATGDIAIPFGVQAFSQSAGARKLVLSLGIPSSAPLLSSGPVEYRLWRGCTGGTAENKAGVVPTAQGWAQYSTLNEASGNLLDWTSNANHGTPVDAVGYAQAGVVGNALSLPDGPYVEMEDSSSLALTTGMTIMVWSKRDAGGTWHYLYDGRGHRYMLQHSPAGNVTCLIANADYSDFITAGPVVASVGSWHLLAATYDGTSLRLSVDAGTPSVTGYVGSINSHAGVSRLGCYTGGGYSYSGVADDLQVHNVARSGNWLSTYYNMTSANGAFWTVGAEQSTATGGPHIFPAHIGRVGPSLAGWR